MPQISEDVRCVSCGKATTADGRCLNPDCDRAQMSHSSTAARQTAKSGGMAAAGDQPRAWRSSGGVD